MFVEGDRIRRHSVPGARCSSKIPAPKLSTAAGRIVMPGMVNTHTHLFQTLLKGLGDDMVVKKWFTCMTGPSAVHLTAAGRPCRRASWLCGVDTLRGHHRG